MRLSAFLLIIPLAACSWQTPATRSAAVLPTVLTATGYGAPPSDTRLNDAQKRLAAMRASKLDAYRALAEQLDGVRLSSVSSVNQHVLSSDVMQARTSALIRGARVVNSMAADDGGYMTTLELTLEAGNVAITSSPGEAIVQAPTAPEPSAPEAKATTTADSNFYYAD
ncbi:LPP20 family lipoprotein [Chitinibacteraceae bacterium HSL-7]